MSWDTRLNVEQGIKQGGAGGRRTWNRALNKVEWVEERGTL